MKHNPINSIYQEVFKELRNTVHNGYVREQINQTRKDCNLHVEHIINAISFQCCPSFKTPLGLFYFSEYSSIQHFLMNWIRRLQMNNSITHTF